MKKRKICFIITSHIHYGRSKLILEELKKNKNVELQIIVGASAILPNYGDILSLLKKDGFEYNAKIVMTLEGGSTVAMAKTAGIGIAEFATAFDNLEPDLIVVRGDRYEILSAVIAGAYLNIPIAHIEGGDVTGTIDESVRHAITKLAHIHFATNEKSRERILRMGENPNYVFCVGCPELEFVVKNNYKVSEELVNYLGVGDIIDLHKSYLVVMQHSVTTEVGQNRSNIEETLKAVYELMVPTVWFWPNVDAGTDEISKAIRVFREEKKPHHMRFIKYLPPEQFVGLLKKAACLVGNSSAGIKEASVLGLPVVNIGTRQNGRLRAENVVDVGYNKNKIKKAIKKQLKHGEYPVSYIYYKKGTSKKIVEILSKVNLYTQKRFYEDLALNKPIN
jgi:UDP-hydrolysing UDP-N-acetyl-D-glucosamine 2-epimerase